MIRKIMKLLVFVCAIFLGLTFSNSSFADDLARGMILYQSNCLQCHGEKGDGNGPEAVTYDTKPTNFTSLGMSVLTDTMFEKAVVEGISTVFMHDWGNKLSHDDVVSILKYVRMLQK